jgi:hypothetical protein
VFVMVGILQLRPRSLRLAGAEGASKAARTTHQTKGRHALNAVLRGETVPVARAPAGIEPCEMVTAATKKKGPLRRAAGQSNRKVQRARRRLRAVNLRRRASCHVRGRCSATVLSEYHLQASACADLAAETGLSGPNPTSTACEASADAEPTTSMLRGEPPVQTEYQACPTTRASIEENFSR